MHEIPSAVTEEECAELARLATGGVILELGSLYGRSTIAMAKTAKMVHSVDWHKGDPHAGLGNTLYDFWQNLEIHGVQEKVVVHVGKIEFIESSFRSFAFDGCFVDSYHSYEAVERDYWIARDLVSPDGWIAFHDYTVPTFGVKKFLDESGDELRFVGSLAIID